MSGRTSRIAVHYCNSDPISCSISGLIGRVVFEAGEVKGVSHRSPGECVAEVPGVRNGLISARVFSAPGSATAYGAVTEGAAWAYGRTLGGGRGERAAAVALRGCPGWLIHVHQRQLRELPTGTYRRTPGRLVSRCASSARAPTARPAPAHSWPLPGRRWIAGGAEVTPGALVEGVASRTRHERLDGPDRLVPAPRRGDRRRVRQTLVRRQRIGHIGESERGADTPGDPELRCACVGGAAVRPAAFLVPSLIPPAYPPPTPGRALHRLRAGRTDHGACRSGQLSHERHSPSPNRLPCRTLVAARSADESDGCTAADR